MEETSYRKSLELLSDDEKATLLAKLCEWEKASPQIADNFKREHFLPEEQMMELMYFIVNEGVPIDNKKIHLRNLMRADYQLKGKEIRVSPERVGFAISEEAYKNFIIKEYFGKGIAIDSSVARNKEDVIALAFKDFFDKLQKGDIDEIEPDCLFKEENKLVWVTWDNNNDDPFSFNQSDTCLGIQTALGLDEKYTGPKILLFIVNVDKLKKEDIFFRPTFCDADFGENFRPTPVDFNDHGLTWPLGEAYSEEEHSKKGRPEAVVQSKYLVLSVIEKMIILDK
ncbi:MAG: hypothetical protein LBL79_01090 [Prevotella sp.]|jgi:hypothetical protein|nr:hypothetical protein [Prevotella sp.]